MLKKDQIINRLKTGYTPVEFATDSKLVSVYKSAYKPLVDKRDLDFFLEIFETGEILLRAWGFLGIYEIVKAKPYLSDNIMPRLHTIIIDLLNDEREIKYFGGTIEITVTLREHHISRLNDLDNSLTFSPVIEYCESFKKKTDHVVAQLYENILAINPDPRVEPILIRHAENVGETDFSIKNHIINAFEKFGNTTAVKEKGIITKIFKTYLKSIKNTSTDSKEEVKKTSLHRNILRVAAILKLYLEDETLAFFDAI